ncbi:MAG: DUF1599 domain-containing protein [Bacteroidaceae bacterium]|nr:DUF1599 domain-containing protein [Bacteroidaceae bacterium]
MNTEEQFRAVMSECREVFAKKLHDYGAAWRILRVPSLTDQIFIKANRIRTLEMKKAMVAEGIRPEFIGIVNYAIIGLIQLELGFAETPNDLSNEQALEAYDRHAEESLQLMLRKNHDYDEAWRGMRISSYTDLILTKIFRTKQIEDLDGKTLVSEGIDANYMDMMNYAVFGLIKLTFE